MHSSRRKKYLKNMRMMYENYASFVNRGLGGKPMSYLDFEKKMEVAMFCDLANKLNASQDDITGAYYAASRVAGREPEVESIILQCDNCHEDVYIDKSMAKMAFKAKAIHCNECLPQFTGGKGIGEIIAERLADL